MQAAGRTIETAEQYAQRAKSGLYEGKEKAKHATQEAAQRAAERVCFLAILISHWVSDLGCFRAKWEVSHSKVGPQYQ